MSVITTAAPAAIPAKGIMGNCAAPDEGAGGVGDADSPAGGVLGIVSGGVVSGSGWPAAM